MPAGDPICRPLIAVAAYLVFLLPTTARAGNIFDDDWTPPASQRRPVPPVDAPATQPTPPSVVNPPPLVPPVTAKEIEPVPASRRPIPEKAAQSQSRKLFKQAFAKELADRSPVARRALAAKLLEEALKVAGVPADHFVLLHGALEAARDGSDLATCIHIADLLAGDYEIDTVQLKAEAALKMLLKSDSPTITTQNFWSGIALIDQLLAAEDYASVARLGTLLRPTVGTDAALGLVLQNRLKEADARRIGYEKISKDLEQLKTAPDDPMANLAVGKYRCFIKGDWTGGLAMLAKGSDAALQQLATRELAGVEGTEANATVGDFWWVFGTEQTEVARTRVLGHAASFYERALEDSAGLRRVAMEKRIAEAAVLGGPRAINLISLIDAEKDTVHGNWKVSDGQLTCARSSYGRLRIPYQPSEEYDFRIEYTRTGGEGVAQLLTHAGHEFAFIGGAMGKNYGFDLIGGRGVNSSKLTVKFAMPVADGKRYSMVIKVRKKSVAAYLDGKLLVEHKTDYSDLKIYDAWSVGEGALGIGSTQPTTFHAIDLIEVSGVGKMLPHRK